MILDKLGRRHGTDKASGGGHNYLVWYERFLAPIRDDEIKVLEIGVGNGASLFTWRDYFPRATIVGFDISDNTREYAGDRISIEIGNQNNIEDLQRVANSHGPFDLIVDDGSHEPEHQIFSLTALCPTYMNPGGFYILEDIMTDQVVNYLGIITHSVVRKAGTWDKVETIAFYEESTVIKLKS